MEGLIGQEVDAGQEDVVPTAGLGLDILDVSLRPVIFFEGQSALMGAVWNAPTELISALQVYIYGKSQNQFYKIPFYIKIVKDS